MTSQTTRPARYGENGRPAPWYAAEGTGNGLDGKLVVTVPVEVTVLLAEAQEKLGIHYADLVARWVQDGAKSALEHHRRGLDYIDDHDRIKGWMPSGDPLLDDGEESDRG